MLRSPGLIALLVTTSIIPAAGSDGAIAAQQSLRRDSAGVTIVTSPLGRAEQRSGWTVDSLPEKQLGVRQGDRRYEFRRISAIAGLPGGGIVVTDGPSDQVRFFDAAGTFVRSAGGYGFGPREFTGGRLVPSGGGDSVYIRDRQLAQLVTFDATGRILGKLPLPPRLTADLWRLPDSRLVMLSRETSRVRSPGVVIIPHTLALVHPAEWRSETIATLELLRVNAWVATGVMMVGGNLPFSPAPLVVVTGDAILMAAGSEPEILKYDTHGKLSAVFRVTSDRIPVGRREFVDSMEQMLRSVDSTLRRQMIAAVPAPNRLPAWKRLEVDREGNIWAEVYNGNPREARVWVVISPDGNVLGTVRTPPDLDVRYIGSDYILGRWRDAEGVEYVRRHRIRKTGRGYSMTR